MRIISGTTEFECDQPTAVAIGKFDGVHLGHRKLLSQIVKAKEDGLEAAVFTFDPPPGVFFSGKPQAELTTKEEKRKLFEKMGIDLLIEFPMNERTAAIPAEEFVREEVAKGNMETVTRLLGSPHLICGQVMHGKRLGRTLGMPTVNLLPPRDKLLPPNGVYLSRMEFGGMNFAGITNIGCKPTVSDSGQMGAETYLYHFQDEIYGEYVELSLYAFRRPEQKFADVEDLKKHMAADIAAGREYWKDQI